MTKKYNTAELIGILKLIGETFITDWNMVMKIVECWDSVRVVEKSWADSFRNDNMDMYPLDLSILRTWSTYSECIDLRFFISDINKLTCDVDIYQGDNMYGHRRDKRFQALLEFENNFINEIKQDILSEFHYFLEQRHREYLEKEKEKWIKKAENNIIKQINIQNEGDENI